MRLVVIEPTVQSWPDRKWFRLQVHLNAQRLFYYLCTLCPPLAETEAPPPPIAHPTRCKRSVLRLG